MHVFCFLQFSMQICSLVVSLFVFSFLVRHPVPFIQWLLQLLAWKVLGFHRNQTHRHQDAWNEILSWREYRSPDVSATLTNNYGDVLTASHKSGEWKGWSLSCIQKTIPAWGDYFRTLWMSINWVNFSIKQNEEGSIRIKKTLHKKKIVNFDILNLQKPSSSSLLSRRNIGLGHHWLQK